MLIVAAKPFIIRASNKPNKPKRSKALGKKLYEAIQHAKLICTNYEDTRECSVAWDQVDELAKAFRHETHVEIEQAILEARNDPWDPLETREYDV